MVFFLLRRIFKSHLKKTIKSYLLLKRRNELAKLSYIRKVLQNTDVVSGHVKYSPLIFGDAFYCASVTVRQFLLSRIVTKRFNRVLSICFAFRSRGFFVIPMEWRKVLKINGIKTYPIIDTLAWKGFVFSYFVLGLYTIVKVGFQKNSRMTSTNSRSIYFVGATGNNLSRGTPDNPKYNLSEWYKSFYSEACSEAMLFPVFDENPTRINFSGTKRLSMDGHMPAIEGWSGKLKFFLWASKTGAFCFYEFCRGNWWHPLLLQQAVLAKQIKMSDETTLFDEYWFSNSAYLFRPLWTYAVELKNKKVNLYFYSTNIEGYTYRNKACPSPVGYGLMTWPNYVVWDERQKNFLQAELGRNINSEVVGPILFSDSGEEIGVDCSDRIAVFDIPMRRLSQMSQLGLPDDLYDHKNIRKFIFDIFNSAATVKQKLVYKSKRRTITNGNYNKYISCVSEGMDVYFAVPECSSYSLIKDSKAVVSIPFTSTAIIARDMGIPSVYYDPTGLINGEESQVARGIPVIANELALKEWLASV